MTDKAETNPCVEFCWYADAVGAPVGYTCVDSLGCRKIVFDNLMKESAETSSKRENDTSPVRWDGRDWCHDPETGVMVDINPTKTNYFRKMWSWLT